MEVETKTGMLRIEVETVTSDEEKMKEATTSKSKVEVDADSDSENFFPAGLGTKLGNGGIILVLFETPSGFALFAYDGVLLLLPNAIENIWIDFVFFERNMALNLRKFLEFKDKAAAINPVTGVNKALTRMILDNHVNDQKLAVGKPEYKEIIEKNLGILCLYDKTVMELMWGLKHCMNDLVPEEKMGLTKEDRLHMSEGLKIVLDRHGLSVEPEMVNQSIIEMACAVHCYDIAINKHSQNLRFAGEKLKKISEIDTDRWNLPTLATALRILCYPQEILPGNPLKAVFNRMVNAHRLRSWVLPELIHFVKEARNAYEAD
uniref:Uncharacterized protein n=1 Tax=Leersia perrieri TaxID=77586 RepID=A0A0D9VWL6_9ORYZ